MYKVYAVNNNNPTNVVAKNGVVLITTNERYTQALIDFRAKMVAYNAHQENRSRLDINSNPRMSELSATPTALGNSLDGQTTIFAVRI